MSNRTDTSTDRPLKQRWMISGAYLDSGEDVEMIVEAPSESAARDIANKRGLVVSSLSLQRDEPVRVVHVPRTEIAPAPTLPPTGYYGAHPIGHSPTVPTINVNMPIRSNSMAMAGFIIGIICLVLGFIPFVNFIAAAVAIVGLILAGVGLLGCARRGGIGFAIGGIVLNGIAIVPTLLFILGSIAVARGVAAEVAKDAERRREVQARVEKAADRTPRAQGGAAAPVPTGEASLGSGIQEIARPFRMGDVQVTVTGVEIGLVELAAPFGGRGSTSQERQLSVRIELKSLSETKRIEYESWAAHSFSFRGKAELVDNFGNRYKRVDFGFGERVKGACDEHETIDPGKTVIDILVFERPIEKAEWLQLTLPRKAVDASDDAEVVIRMTEVQSSS